MSKLSTSLPGGAWTLGDLTVSRFGYGAMQLAGPGVLREAVGLGITHIDTSGAYGPGVTNQLIREALYPYPESLHIVTKVGSNRDSDGGWPPAREPADLRRSVSENLANLGLEALDVVNLRLGNAQGPQPGSLAEPFETLAALRQQTRSSHSATAAQIREVISAGGLQWDTRSRLAV